MLRFGKLVANSYELYDLTCTFSYDLIICTKLIKSDSKVIHNVTKEFYFK